MVSASKSWPKCHQSLPYYTEHDKKKKLDQNIAAFLLGKYCTKSTVAKSIWKQSDFSVKYLMSVMD